MSKVKVNYSRNAGKLLRSRVIDIEEANECFPFFLFLKESLRQQYTGGKMNH